MEFFIIVLLVLLAFYLIKNDIGRGVDPHESNRLEQMRAERTERAAAKKVYQKWKIVEKEKAEAAEKLAQQLKISKDNAAEKLKHRFTALKSNLPFHTSKKTPSAELADHDKQMWQEVTKLVEEQDGKKATLYFVKIRSLMDDREYFKIGITTKNVKTMFKKSTEIELLEEVKIFDTEKWKAAFLEYHFLREFRLYDGLSTSIGEQRPEVRFSGYTEVVRSNSVNKITEYFEELDVYNRIYLR